jgi:flagellar biosynthesis/type III secretory pathway protein FliH
MFNVNMGKNDDLMTTCKPLAEYAWIVDTIRKYEAMLKDAVEREKVLDIAIDRTIDAIPDDFVTRTYLEAHRAEVKGMLLTEYNEAKAMELFREEGREEGRKEGRAEGRKEGRAEGRAQGMNTFSALIKRLLELGRTEDVARVTSDPAYRDKLIAEFKLA